MDRAGSSGGFSKVRQSLGSRLRGVTPERPAHPSGDLSDRIAYVGELVLLAAFLLTPLTTLRPATNVTFGDCFLAVAVAIAAVILVLRRRSPAVPKWVWIGTGLLLLSIAAVEVFPPQSLDDLYATFTGTPYGSSLAAAMRLIVALVVVPVAVAIIVSRWSTIHLLVNAWIVGVSASCAVAVIDALFGFGLQASLANNPAEVTGFLGLEPGRYVGLGVHPTSFSVTVMMVSPLVLSKMTDSRRVLLFSPLFLLLVFAVILSGSRGGLVAIALATVLTVAFNPAVRGAIFNRQPRVLATLAANLVACGALLFLGPLHTFFGTSPDLSPATIEKEARPGANGNWVTNPGLKRNLDGWAPFGDTATISRHRIEAGGGGRDRWAVRTVTKGHKFPQDSEGYPEGHTVVADVAVSKTYTASLNVLAEPGVTYDLALQQINGYDIESANAIRLRGNGKWQSPSVSLTFGPVGTRAVLNLHTAERLQATTFYSYGARIETSSRSPESQSVPALAGTDASSSEPDESGTLSRLNPFGLSAQSSDSERLRFIEDSIDYIVDRPVPGYGFQWIEVSHDIYLQLLLSGGLIALVGYLLVVAGYLREGMQIRSRVPENLRDIDVALMISMVAFLVMGLVQTDLVDRYLYLPVALILSMSFMVASLGSRETSTKQEK